MLGTSSDGNRIKQDCYLVQVTPVATHMNVNVQQAAPKIGLLPGADSTAL